MNEPTNRLHQLVDLAVEGELDEAGHQELEGLLLEDPSAIQAFRRRINLHDMLEKKLFVDGMDKVHQVQLQLKEAHEQKHAALIRRTARWALAASLIAVFGLVLIFMKPEPSTLTGLQVTTREAAWDGAAPGHDALRADRPYRLTAGQVSLFFPHGGAVTLEGPAEFSIQSTMRMQVDSGTLTARIPPKGHGFTIHTPNGKVIDLGTAFSVQVGRNSTDVHVLEGKVKVQSSSGLEELEAGQSFHLDSVLAGVVGQLKENDLLAHKRLWEMTADIESTEKMRVVMSPIHAGKDRQNLLIVPEKQAMRLTRPLKIDISSPGLVENRSQFSPRTLPADTRLSSYLVISPRIKKNHFTRFEGRVTFKQPIIGIYVDDITRSFYGSKIWDTPWPGAHFDFPSREKRRTNLHDVCEISADRRTLHIISNVGQPLGDQLRVLVESPLK